MANILAVLSMPHPTKEASPCMKCQSHGWMDGWMDHVATPYGGMVRA